MRQFTSIATIIASVALLAACSSTKVSEPAPVTSGTQQGATAPATGSGASSGSDVDPLNDPNSVLAKRSIYFDFDQYSIKPEFNNIVAAHANYLKSNAGQKVVIQGNTDARGGSEYNLALGQKRAEAVRKALVTLGVSDAQVEAVSFGKEKPKAQGDNEAAWAENRRSDIAYK